MCGRYVMALRAGDLVDALSAAGLDDVEVPAPTAIQQSWNIAPTASVPILVERLVEADDAEDAGADGSAAPASTLREIHTARWGLLPGWADSLSFSSKTFNARSETAASKPSFRSAVRRRRCAVPAQGYYEWRSSVDETTGKVVRTPHYIRPADGSVLLFAGLYEWWQDPALAAAGADSWLLSTTILTGPSPEPGVDDGDGDSGDVAQTLRTLADLHERIPLAMDAETAAAWIAPGERSREAATADVERLRARAHDVAAGWTVHEVGRAVGDVRHDSPELVEPPASLF